MAITSQLVHRAPMRAAATERSAVPDHGPWLFLAAPFSFALALATVVYLASVSF